MIRNRLKLGIEDLSSLVPGKFRNHQNPETGAYRRDFLIDKV